MRRRQHRIGSIVPGTFAHVIRQFMASPSFTSKAESTRRNWGSMLRLAEEESGLGGCSVQVIRPAIIQGFLDALADTPGNQTIARTALKQVEAFAVVRDLVPYPFMTGTSVVGSEGGHEPWTFEQVALAEQHARPDIARVITLAVNTGQRGSDIVKMRWSDIEEQDGRQGINVIQQKTGVRLWIPFAAAFAEHVGTWERKPPFFLVLKSNGEQYTRPQLSTAWYEERDSNEALKPLKEAGLVLHGLRATAVVRLRKVGATVLEIASMIGMSEQMVARYSRLADKTELSLAAVIRLERTAGEQKSQTHKGSGG